MKGISFSCIAILVMCFSNCAVLKKENPRIDKLQCELTNSHFYSVLVNGMIDTELELMEKGQCLYRYGAQRYRGEWQLSTNGRYIHIKARKILKLVTTSEETGEILNDEFDVINMRLRIKNINTLKMEDTKWRYKRK